MKFIGQGFLKLEPE